MTATLLMMKLNSPLAWQERKYLPSCLPKDKRNAVLLYYFFEMSDAEIAQLQAIPRSTVQYRRTSSFELLKRYLEERAYDENDW